MKKRQKKAKKGLYHPVNWPLHVGFGIMHLLAYLPKPCKRLLGKFIGWALLHSNGKMRHIAKTNIDHCFPQLDDAARLAMLEENFYLLGMMLMESLNTIWPSKTNILPTIGTITGLEHLEKALAEKRGILLLFSHFIEIYIVGYLLIKKMGMPFAVMYHSPRNAVLKRFFDINLKKHCSAVFTRKDVHKMVTHLRAGNLVWYAPDLEPNKKHRVFAPFFNIPTATFTTTARIAEMANTVNILIAFYRRDNEAVYDIEFHAPLNNFPSDNEEKDAALLNNKVEELIKVKPAQYLWIYKRFSKMPGDKPGLYSKP